MLMATPVAPHGACYRALDDLLVARDLGETWHGPPLWLISAVVVGPLGL
jgi:hypothetical protein